jgi:hypothetical protein
MRSNPTIERDARKNSARPSLRTLEAMARARFASVLVLGWSAIQVWTLLLLHFYPLQHIVGWSLSVLALLIAIALWVEKPWARVLFLVFGGGFVVFYAVVFYLSGFSCATGSGCSIPLLLSQPLLLIAALALMVRPLASNPTIERDAPQAARPSS